MENLTFSQAIEFMKQGKRVQRKGWNGKGMYVFMSDESLLKTIKENLGKDVYPFLIMKSADDKFVPGWLASQADILANDWQQFRNLK